MFWDGAIDRIFIFKLIGLSNIWNIWSYLLYYPKQNKKQMLNEIKRTWLLPIEASKNKLLIGRTTTLLNHIPDTSEKGPWTTEKNK